MSARPKEQDASTAAPPAGARAAEWDAAELIIVRPELQSRLQRGGAVLITALFWLVWTWLWLPLGSLLAWKAGLTASPDALAATGGWTGLWSVIVEHARSGAILIGLLIGWALLNLMRFRGKERRAARPAVGMDRLAAEAGTTPAILAQWQAASVMRVSHGEGGEITRVEILIH